MKRLKEISVLFVFILLTSIALSACTSQNTAASSIVSNADESKIDEESILSIVEELSSEKYKGRLVGTKENEMAAQYIAEQFKQIGLESPKGLNNYLQSYSTQVLLINEEPVMQLEDKEGNIIKRFKYSENFLFRALSSTGNIDVKAPLYLVDSIETMSDSGDAIKNEIALFPLLANQNSTTADLIASFKQVGALAGIGEFDIKSPQREYSNLTATPMRGTWMMGPYDPYLIVDNDTFKELTEAANKELLLHIKCNFYHNFHKEVPNVIGFIPGSDPELKDEYIIIGAHFDHVGDNKNGTYNPGALDNASGTAGLIEIARIIKNSDTPPKKSIIIAAFNGEEAGMTGSLHYAGNPIYPLDKSVMICLDMIGCSADIPITIATADSHASKLQDELCKYAKELNIKYTTNIITGSDHSSFAQKGTDSVLLINEDWLNGYHGPNDNMEDVSKTNMEQIVKLVLRYVDSNAY